MDARSEFASRAQIVEIGRLMHQKNLLAAADGNLSVRLDSDHILITPSGLSKGFLTADQLLIVDPDGRPVGGQTLPARSLTPSTEIRMHLECYRRRSDVRAVIHAHPPHAIACTLAGLSLSKCTLPEVVYDLGIIPTAPYATPASEENPRAIGGLVESYDAIILDRHGSLTVGSTLWDAYFRLERVEHSAQITLYANAVTQVQPLSNDAISKLAAMRQNVFAARGRDVCTECNACSLSERNPMRTHSSYSPRDLENIEVLIAEEIKRNI